MVSGRLVLETPKDRKDLIFGDGSFHAQEEYSEVARGIPSEAEYSITFAQR